MLFLNFGHASTPLAGEGSEQVVRVDKPVPNLKDPSDPREAEEAALALLREVAGELRGARGNGSAIVVALPGASLVAAAVVTALHGALGFYPQVMVATRTEAGGFVYDLRRAYGLEKIRDEARGLRGELGL